MLRNRQRDRFGIGLTNCLQILLPCLVAITLTGGSVAHGAMILSPEGIARGLTLSTFATGFQSPVPGNGPGPQGITFLPDGQVLVVDVFNRLQRFNNVNGQNASSVPVIHTYPGGLSGRDLVTIGGQTYMCTLNLVTRIDTNNGEVLNTVFSGGPQPPAYTSLATNPANGWLFVSGFNSGFHHVNPANGQFSPQFGLGYGMQVSPDGTKLYSASILGHIFRNDIGGTGFIDYGAVPGNFQQGTAADGTCSPYDVALGFGLLSDRLLANCNDGTIWELNLQSHVYTQIATGGTWGHRMTVDPSGNGDVLLTQRDRILRLSGIPEPASLSLLAIGCVFIFRRHGSASKVAT